MCAGNKKCTECAKKQNEKYLDFDGDIEEGVLDGDFDNANGERLDQLAKEQARPSKEMERTLKKAVKEDDLIETNNSTESSIQQLEESKKKARKVLIIGGVSLLAVAGLVTFFVLRKKK